MSNATSVSDIEREEHDKTYGVKKVTAYADDGNGNLVRQAIDGFNLPKYDYVSAAYNDGTFTEVYVFKTGGASGTTVATITVIYVDITKDKLVSITKT